MSRLQCLPTELLNAILDSLDDSDVARLMSCSKAFHQNLEPALYGTGNGCNRAMYWGCRKGNQHAIRLALSYGASVSTIDNPTAIQKNRCKNVDQPSRLPKVSTLCLAAKNGDLDVFKYLIHAALALMTRVLPRKRGKK